MQYYNKKTGKRITCEEAYLMRDNEKVVIDETKDGEEIEKICPRCGNPKIMYWCAECECNGESETCLQCGKDSAKIDKNYHKNCN